MIRSIREKLYRWASLHVDIKDFDVTDIKYLLQNDYIREYVTFYDLFFIQYNNKFT